MNAGLDADKPFAAFFLYDKKDGHLDNVSGHLYEYSVNGAKLLHSSGKYNNVYSGDSLKGGGTGEESLDLLLVMHSRHKFPQHPDRRGDARDFMRRGAIRHSAKLLVASNNDFGDSFGQFGFDDYYGPGSRWIRRSVLTSEGYFVVADEYIPSEKLNDDYVAGPVWHLALGERKVFGRQERNWFDAPAFDRAWWQKKKMRVLAYIHDDDELTFGTLQQRHSQDTDANVTAFAYRQVRSGRPERFLSVFIPHEAKDVAAELAAAVETSVTGSGHYVAKIRKTTVTIKPDGKWSVQPAIATSIRVRAVAEFIAVEVKDDERPFAIDIVEERHRRADLVRFVIPFHHQRVGDRFARQDHSVTNTVAIQVEPVGLG